MGIYSRLRALALAAIVALPVVARTEATAPVDLAPETVNDLCSYLKDVEAKTKEACAPEALVALKVQDAAAFAEKLALVHKRKADVRVAYDFLKKPPPDGAAPLRTGASATPAVPDPSHLVPPINERTFLVWIGADDPDFKSVEARRLKTQAAALERDAQGPVSAERRKEIEGELARNHTELAGIEKIKDPAELNCFLGESCGSRAGFSGAPVAAFGSDSSWTAADYARANAQERAQNHFPGGKLDRGVPELSFGEAVGNSPLGPLSTPPQGGGGSPVKTAAELALAAAGGLLLFGGLGGQKLEEKFPGLRRNMGIAALIGGTLATGGLAWEAYAARAAAVAPIAASPEVEKEISDTGTATTRLSFDWSRAQHIFDRAKGGHISPSTEGGREQAAQIFENIANDPKNYRPDFPIPRDASDAGVQVYAKVLQTGQQIWTYVRNGRIIDAGVNPPGQDR